MLNIKKKDKVVVLAGKDKGKEGENSCCRKNNKAPGIWQNYLCQIKILSSR